MHACMPILQLITKEAALYYTSFSPTNSRGVKVDDVLLLMVIIGYTLSTMYSIESLLFLSKKLGLCILACISSS